jgi:hypothetical protein
VEKACLVFITRIDTTEKTQYCVDAAVWAGKTKYGFTLVMRHCVAPCRKIQSNLMTRTLIAAFLIVLVAACSRRPKSQVSESELRRLDSVGTVYSQMAHAIATADTSHDQVFTDTLCQITFQCPELWTIQPDKTPFYGTDCAFGLKAPDWDSTIVKDEFDVSECSIYIAIYAGALDSTAERFGLFCEDSIWSIEGRAGARDDAVSIRSPYWTGILGESEVGLYRKNGGGYYAAETTLVAYLDNGKGKLVQIVADRAFADKVIFDHIVNSIRF